MTTAEGGSGNTAGGRPLGSIKRGGGTRRPIVSGSGDGGRLGAQNGWEIFGLDQAGVGGARRPKIGCWVWKGGFWLVLVGVPACKSILFGG
jgi:hypothetical protein